MTLDSNLTSEGAIEKMRELRGPRAVQSVKVRGRVGYVLFANKIIVANNVYV